MWDAMKNPAPATVLCDVEAQHSFQQQCWGKLLGEVSPFFTHGSVFTVPSPNSALALSGSAFPQICNTSPAPLCFVHKMDSFLCFSGGKYLPGSDEQGWDFNAVEPVLELSEAGRFSTGKSLQHRMLCQKERACVSWGNKKTSVWHLPVGSQSWHGLGANNELLRTFKL